MNRSSSANSSKASVVGVERARLLANNERADWKQWGPYLSERQWGTVREDYSASGTAWEYFPHDHARSRAYRWGEDGLGGFSDQRQRLCFSLALWNSHDPILKERLFGLTNSQGNHGEDVKELYYYLDATPTHSYLKMLYKYPQAAFPYERLLAENKRRGRGDAEFELLDSGVLNDSRYFDVFVEYAQVTPGDILIRITAHNRGAHEAPLHLLPQLWFRNTWSWQENSDKPNLRMASTRSIKAHHSELGDRVLELDREPTALLFCDNESNAQKLWGVPQQQSYPKDAFHDYVVHGKSDAVNAERTGTKSAALYQFNVAGGQSVQLRLRLRTPANDNSKDTAFEKFDALFADRIREADEFYATFQYDSQSDDSKQIQRQAFAGMLWSKQYFHYDVLRWLKGDPTQPTPPPQRWQGRNADWQHLNNSDVLSMPDKWEYPWYASWDLAFHCVQFAYLDAQFAKAQLVLLTREWYMHPDAQLPAYEWAFGDANPPLHAWAAMRVYQIDREINGAGDRDFLERVFHKLMLNFTWWVNRKDVDGRNLFQGGFLGLDNIGVIDRNVALRNGGYLDQADGTGWMAMYALNLMQIALELARTDHVYEDIATKFFEHFLQIADAMTRIGSHGVSLWDETDQFFYDVLQQADGSAVTLPLRSVVGLIPLLAVETIEPEMLKRLPTFAGRMEWYLKHRPELAALVSRWTEPGRGERRLLSMLRGHRIKALLKRMLDETEFFSDHGVRALSKIYGEHPFVFQLNGEQFTVKYEPGESESGMFGGNSNWRGPVWFPINFLIIESLEKLHHYYGDDFLVECPTGSGKFLTLNQIANELARRLARIFLKDKDGKRPLYRNYPAMQNDPLFNDHLLFYEYFHGDSGRGVGASHQTGWTGLIAKLLMSRYQSDEPLTTGEHAQANAKVQSDKQKK